MIESHATILPNADSGNKNSVAENVMQLATRVRGFQSHECMLAFHVLSASPGAIIQAEAMKRPFVASRPRDHARPESSISVDNRPWANLCAANNLSPAEAVSIAYYGTVGLQRPKTAFEVSMDKNKSFRITFAS